MEGWFFLRVGLILREYAVFVQEIRDAATKEIFVLKKTIS
jgi:hypothetical protein